MSNKQIITALSITWALCLIGIVFGALMINAPMNNGMDTTFNIIGTAFLVVGAVFFGYFGSLATQQAQQARSV